MKATAKSPMSTTRKIAIATVVGVGIAAPVAYALLRRRKVRNALKKSLIAKKDQALATAENHGGVAARAARFLRVGGAAAMKPAKAKGRSVSRPVARRVKQK